MNSKMKECLKMIETLDKKGGAEAKSFKDRCRANLKTYMTKYENLIKKLRQDTLRKRQATRVIKPVSQDPAKLQKDMLDRDLEMYRKGAGKKKLGNKVLDLRPALVEVGKLHSGMSEIVLKVHFQKFGPVESVEILDSQQKAYVRFKDRMEAEQAVKLGTSMTDYLSGWNFELALVDKVPAETLEADKTLENAFDDL